MNKITQLLTRRIKKIYPSQQAMKTTNLPKILKKYTSGWVSISKDHRKIIASGKTLKSLLGKLKTMNNPKGYLMKAARDYSGYVEK